MSAVNEMNAYVLLGVKPGVGRADLQAAWKDLVRAYRPELHKTNPIAAQRKLIEINAAFELLAKVEASLPSEAESLRKPRPKPPQNPFRSKSQPRALRTPSYAPRPRPKSVAKPAAPKRFVVIDTTTDVPEDKVTVVYPSHAKRRKWTDAERLAARKAAVAFATARAVLEDTTRAPTDLVEL